MGQYYRVYLERNGKAKVFNGFVDGEYTMAKLMEHSWWDNYFVNTICHEIHHNPARIAWVGDYAEEFEFYNKVWKSNGFGVKEAQVVLGGKFLVNHTKKEYINCTTYYDRSSEKYFGDNYDCIHPLPLLTVIGNGRGGGDYRGINMEYVGRWCMDAISIENNQPEEYTEISPTFIERW